MRAAQLLEHHGIAANPFAEEDAQTDPVFKQHCIGRTYHPSWDKIYGDPAEPATSIVFGEKGAGKTAMRLQVVRHLEDYNASRPDRRVFVIEYDDFNPFLDRFRGRLGGRQQRPDRALAQWRLWDHMDAILSLGVIRLVDAVIEPPAGVTAAAAVADDRLARLDRWQVRDLLLLAACYDQSTAESFRNRWHRLRRRLRYGIWRSYLPVLLGWVITAAMAGVIAAQGWWSWLSKPWPYLLAALGWAPWLVRRVSWTWRSARLARNLRVLRHEVRPLAEVLASMTADDLSGQPLPDSPRTDDRYELLLKLQQVLRTLGYPGIVVLVDRVDEPHLINGSAELMRAFLWPMLDNKFLKHPGLGLKLLLPIELARFVEREDRDFYQRARLDKQNMVPSLVWTGQALLDVANDRIRACAAPGRQPTLRALLDDSISEARLLGALQSLRGPRHLFKFMYRLLMAHCGAHSDQQPAWRIEASTFESVLALYQRDQDAFDRGVGAG